MLGEAFPHGFGLCSLMLFESQEHSAAAAGAAFPALHPAPTCRVKPGSYGKDTKRPPAPPAFRAARPRLLPGGKSILCGCAALSLRILMSGK